MFRSLLSMAERLIAPHLCPACDAEQFNRGLCGACWAKLTLISDQACPQCGIPFSLPVILGEPASRCGNCRANAPDFDAAVSAVVYADPARHMILAFKHGDRQDIAPVLAQLMVAKTRPLMEQADLVLPLPLHRTRFFKRRFNQSAELLRHLHHLCRGDITVNTKILIRKKATTPQGYKTKAQRIEAMRGAFDVPKHHRATIKNAHILIIDDVLTTGASLSSAARCLKRAGAARVSVSTVARVC